MPKKGGFNESEVMERQTLYGMNLIDVKLKSIVYLLFMEAITPFYIFQVFRYNTGSVYCFENELTGDQTYTKSVNDHFENSFLKIKLSNMTNIFKCT